MAKQDTLEITDETIERVTEALGTREEISPYGLHKVLGSLGYNVRPQMMYNYAKNGLFPTRRNPTNHIVVDRENAIEFLAKYVTRNAG